MTAVAPIAASLPVIAGAPLDIPQDFADQLNAAQATGETLARQFRREHGGTDRSLIADWAFYKLGFPPKTDDADLAVLHALERTRTPDATERAKFWAKNGLGTEWDALLAQYTSKVGPAQARAAQQLLHDALMLTNTAATNAKSASLRSRPFVVDTTLTTALDKPGNNPSYPSGHAAAAYAAATVLAKLMPDRAAEFLGMAREVAFSRAYAGLHFPTDLAAGAQVGTTVAAYLAGVAHVAQQRGTGTSGGTGAPNGNAGIAGGLSPRRRIPASSLQGVALLNAGRLIV